MLCDQGGGVMQHLLFRSAKNCLNPTLEQMLCDQGGWVSCSIYSEVPNLEWILLGLDAV